MLKKLYYSVISLIFILTLSVNLKAEQLPFNIKESTKIIYLDIWASWCTPCKASFPWMSTLNDEFESRGLEIIAVNVDSKREDAERFLKKNTPNFRIEYDENKSIIKQFNLSVMPTSYILDRNGEILYVHTGFTNKSSTEIHNKIEELLK